MTAMTWDEAYELVSLRIQEDGVPWSIAYNEFRRLIGGASISSTMSVGKRLQALAEARDKGTS